VSDTNYTALLRPSTFPSLRSLAIYFDGLGSTACIPSADLYDQLSCVVFVDLEQSVNLPFDILPPTCLPFANIALSALGLSRGRLSSVVHARIRTDDPGDAEGERASHLEDLADLLNNLDPMTSRLKRLSLPVDYDPFVQDPPSSSPAVLHVISTAATGNVEVVFEEGEAEIGGAFVPLSTVEYAKRFRAEQEQEARDEVERGKQGAVA
jgi:hypothetical protein